ncbi:MAG: hypothetical protein H6702_02795 [Myxococcales bacterium]|nr:hypothetical protein [Myxococcales bacterium]
MSDDRPGEGEGRRGRSLLDSIMPDLVKRALAQGVEAVNEEKLKETLVAELLRKAVTKGGEVVDHTEDSFRRMIADLPLPKEVVERLSSRADEYKAELLRLVKDELHEFLARIDLGHELQKMLTSLSFEITTEVRFIPNDKGVGARPDVKAKARVKRSRRGRKGEDAQDSDVDGGDEDS